jgi:type IV secretory pathway VirB10-like protein
MDGENQETGWPEAEEAGETAGGEFQETAESGPEETYEMTAEEATGFKTPGKRAGPGFLNRKRITMALCIGFAVVAAGSFAMNSAKAGKKSGGPESGGRAGSGTPEFLRNQMERAYAPRDGGEPGGAEFAEAPPGGSVPGESAAPAVYWTGGGNPDGADGGSPADGLSRPGAENGPGPPPPQARSAPSGSAGTPARQTANYSPLVPRQIEGSLFGGGAQPAQTAGAAAQYPYMAAGQGQSAADGYLRQAMAAQNAAAPVRAQDGGQPLYSGESGGALNSGYFLGDNALWIGTVVPGILETAINTDLPGNAVARATRNIYDSRTGTRLLIPQGSLLVARYGSSVSYAQRRVQIVWDTLVRPDGFQIDLEGMNGVDKKGMSGQEAEYHENWFEYAKAAGLIAMFSIANSKMTEEAARYASASTASGIAQANSEFVNEMGGGIVSRAMNIQPTLTVESGTVVNIMLNKTVYLPPAEDYPAVKKYTLK